MQYLLWLSPRHHPGYNNIFFTLDSRPLAYLFLMPLKGVSHVLLGAGGGVRLIPPNIVRKQTSALKSRGWDPVLIAQVG